MVKWSRVKLVFSIVTAAGFWQTLRERIVFASPAPSRRPSDESARGATLPTQFDLVAALHVHSTYSDGTGTTEEIAEAAARAKIDYLLITDHSTLAAQANAESGWRAGSRVLIGVGTEISTDTGHLLLCNLPDDFDVEPGQAQEIMARTVACGGYGFIALPCDLKDHWRDFSKRDESFGLEVFNLSAVARTKINLPSFLLALLRYSGKRPLSTFNLITGRPQDELDLWDRLSAEAFEAGSAMPRAIGCLDAHAVMRFGGKEYPYPTYEEVFRTLRTHILVSEPLSHDSQNVKADMDAVNNSLRKGNCYISYDNFGDATGFSFYARTEKEIVGGMGDACSISLQRPVFLDIASPCRKSIIKILRNGRVIVKSRGSAIHYKVSEPGVYRVEVDNYALRLGSICLNTHPWIFSNPIEVRAAHA